MLPFLDIFNCNCKKLRQIQTFLKLTNFAGFWFEIGLLSVRQRNQRKFNWIYKISWLTGWKLIPATRKMWESLSGFEKKNVWKFIGFSGRLLNLTTTKIEFIWVNEIGISSVSTVCRQEIRKKSVFRVKSPKTIHKLKF